MYKRLWSCHKTDYTPKYWYLPAGGKVNHIHQSVSVSEERFEPAASLSKIFKCHSWTSFSKIANGLFIQGPF
jgi:hypothetical protein